MVSLLRCPFPPLLFFVWWRTPQEEEKMSGKKQQTNGGDDRKDQHQEYQRGGSQRGSRGKDGGGGKKGRNYDYPQFRNQKPVDKDIPLKFNYPSAASSSPSPSPSPSSSSSSSSSQRTPHITQNYFYDQFETVCSSSEETSFVELLDKPILVVLREGKNIVGICRSFDQFANLVIEEAYERIFVGLKYADIPLGLYLIRGDNLFLVGELGDDKESKLVKVDQSEIIEEYTAIQKEKEKKRQLLQSSTQSRYLDDL